MYVRINYGSDPTLPDKDRENRSVIYECDEFHINQPIDDDTKVYIRLEPEGKVLDIDKEHVEVYIMNNDGKTIDKYRWAQDVVRIMKERKLQEK